MRLRQWTRERTPKGTSRGKSRSKFFEEEDYDNDLMKALSEIPLNKLASIDEAFVILDGGLGAIFSASMARRAAVSRCSEKSAPTVTLDALKKHIGSETLGGSMLRRATARIVNPLRKIHAQRATMNMLTDLAGPHTLSPANYLSNRSNSTQNSDSDRGSPRALSAISSDGDRETSSEDDSIPASCQLPADPILREWAREYLSLTPDRLQGLENSEEFRWKLAHQMLCWQASRADKLGARPSTAPSVMSVSGSIDMSASETYESRHSAISSTIAESVALGSPHATADATITISIEKPIALSKVPQKILKDPPPGFIIAERSLFGLTHHLDAQRMRRSRTPTPLLPLDSDIGPKEIDMNSPRQKQPTLGAQTTTMKAPFTRQAMQAVASNMHSRFFHGQVVSPCSWSNELSSISKGDSIPTPRRLPSRGQTRNPPLGASLRRPQAFVEPHSEIDAADVSHAPELYYLRCCESKALVPCPAVWRNFGAGQGMIDASERSLSDADLSAIIETVALLTQDGHMVRKLDFGKNGLTDIGVNHITSFFFGHLRACNALTTISLAGNSGIKFLNEESLCRFSQAVASLPSLESLDLSGVLLHGQAACTFFDELKGSGSLKKLLLAGCGLGRLSQTECVAVASLVAIRKEGEAGLEKLDLSANYFGRVGLRAVGAAARYARIKTLSFAGNSLSSKGVQDSKEQVQFHPMQLLFEGLHSNKSLTELNLSSCGLGPDSAFVLEDAFDRHPVVASLDLSHNPLGDAGIRCVLRLLLRASTITQCDLTHHREADATAHRVRFLHAQPAGVYHLNLRYPHERSTLRTLIRTSLTLISSLGDADVSQRMADNPFWFFKFDSKQAKPVVERDCESDRWIIQPQGVFNFAFQPPLSGSALQASLDTVSGTSSPAVPVSNVDAFRKNKASFRGSLSSGNSLTMPVLSATLDGQPFRRRSVRESRELPQELNLGLISESIGQISSVREGEVDWRELTKILTDVRMKVPAIRYPIFRGMFLSFITRDQQMRFIHACSKDMAFNCPQVSQLCEDRPEMATQLLSCLFPSIRGRTPQLLLLGTVSVATSPAVTRDVSTYLWFQEGNITGRYKLDLEKPADYAVGESCLIANAWESEVGKLMGKPDCSQRGTYEMLRNEAHNQVRFHYGREWMLPSHGIFRFDYSTIRRPPTGLGVMHEEPEVSKYLQKSTVSLEAKLKALRAVSVHLYLSTSQLKHLLKCFPMGECRQELFCILHAHVTDPIRLLSPELLHCDAMFNDCDRRVLLERIGPLHLLNPIFPERTEYKCNLAIYEQWKVMDYLVQLQAKEPGSRTAGTGNLIRLGCVPASWVEKGVPRDIDETLICTYESLHPKKTCRHELAEKFSVNQFR